MCVVCGFEFVCCFVFVCDMRVCVCVCVCVCVSVTVYGIWFSLFRGDMRGGASGKQGSSGVCVCVCVRVSV